MPQLRDDRDDRVLRCLRRGAHSAARPHAARACREARPCTDQHRRKDGAVRSRSAPVTRRAHGGVEQGSWQALHRPFALFVVANVIFFALQAITGGAVLSFAARFSPAPSGLERAGAVSREQPAREHSHVTGPIRASLRSSRPIECQVAHRADVTGVRIDPSPSFSASGVLSWCTSCSRCTCIRSSCSCSVRRSLRQD